MRYKVLGIATLAAMTLQAGCSIFPYHEKFMCENMNDFGQCLDVQGAYEVAKTGSPSMKEGQNIEKNTRTFQTVSGITTRTVDPDKAFEQQRYQTLAKVVEEPSAPLVKQPEVVRTLILNYSDKKRVGAPLYGHRFIYFFGTDPEWVLSPYTERTRVEQLSIGVNELDEY